MHSTAVQRQSLAAAVFAAGWAALVIMGAPGPASAQGNQPSATSPRAADSPGVNSGGAGPEGREQAPVGHRQPRRQDVPSNASRDEGREFEAERELDQKLQICRGC
jgi:hypothetical protein